MSRVGIGVSGGAWPMDSSIAVPAYFMPQGVPADLIATKYGFSLDDVNAYAVAKPAARCEGLEEGRFKNSVIPVKDVNGLTILAKDEHMRPTTDNAVAWTVAAVLCHRRTRWVALTRWRSNPIRKSNVSIMSTMRVIPLESSMAPGRCCSEARRRAPGMG